MAKPLSQWPQDVAPITPSDLLDQSDESTVGCYTPSSSSDSKPTRRVVYRVCRRTGRRFLISGTSDAANIHDERPTAKDEAIVDLTSQLAALSRRVDDLSLKQTSSPVVIDSGTWSTLKVRSWEHPQVHTAGRVSFSKKFKTAPNVLVNMSAADVSRNANFRVKVYATDIDAAGFTANADTWADTKMHSCEVSWLAIGS